MEWGYKATRSKLDSAGTLLLAMRGFLCRSAHEQNLSAADNVSRVALGDTIQFYYVARDRKVHEFGAYTIIEPHMHSRPELFGARVEETALYRVEEASFIREIDKVNAYLPDPVLGQFTGWIIRKSAKARPYDRAAFPGQGTLVVL